MNTHIKQITLSGKYNSLILNNNVFLAPMAGVTDIPFRKICREFSPALTFTEMASSKALEYDNEKTKNLLGIMEDERPSAVQIFGSNPDNIKNAILKLNECDNIDIIDINMGCPAPKLVKNGDGAGLLLDLKNIEQVVKEAVKTSKKIVTVKTRRGFDEQRITACEVAKICQDNGVSMITVHGRTREEYYTGKANLDIIKKVKESINIPVIGNGDIVDLESANNMFEKTGCDGIMIARGAQGNPWIFKEILDGNKITITNEERLQTMLKHIDYAVKYENEKIATLKLRKHIAWYLKGLENSSKIKDTINKLEDITKVKQVLIDFLSI